MIQTEEDMNRLNNQDENELVRITIELPIWVVKKVDELAAELSIDRSELISRWIQDELKQEG